MQKIYGFQLRRINHRFQVECRQSCYSTIALANAYQPNIVEADKWENWLQSKHGSNSVNGDGKLGKFRMILPPPNVTGHLHLGHALMATVQDVICRQKRQMGYEVEWIPGMDHAGIATQVVVEKKLFKELNKSRQQIGRDQFLKYVWQWKQEKESDIRKDLQKLYCSLSWNKQYFTMDEHQAYAVNEAFIRLFNDGLIRRKESLVNWSCALESVISDIEVENLEILGPTEVAVPGYSRNITFGRIYDIKYKIMDSVSDEYIIVSTTRPETLLGDVAVAVHPTDERYLKFRQLTHDVNLWHPFRQEPIPLVFDVEVDPNFGTGAMKLTPAHDRLDFEIAHKHLLKPISVFLENGVVSTQYTDFALKPRFQAREQILEKLAELNLLVDVRSHRMQLPICTRSKDVIEYMLREQWFLHCQSMADRALSELLSGRLQIIPSNFEIDWQQWLADCHDWCISRQLWWGHQIPAYQATSNDNNKNTVWVAAHNTKDALNKAQHLLSTTDISLKRDEDVLDTWFSSALLPLTTAHWPLVKYNQQYPLDIMETGHDILFFWVARMVMLGLQLDGRAPFQKILLNGIVCDSHGRKMSKSLGNVIKPQQIINGSTLESLKEEIQNAHNEGILSANEMQKSIENIQLLFPKGMPQCGTDALRFTLCSHNIKSHFINFDISECYTNKLFLNKIWQAMRFLLNAAETLQESLNYIDESKIMELGNWDLWILSRLSTTLDNCQQSCEQYDFHMTTAVLKQFLYGNLCDVYLETTKSNIRAKNAKASLQCATLATCLASSLRALHPFTPFICEELLQHLPPQHFQLPTDRWYNRLLEEDITQILAICQNIRQLKSRNQISGKHQPHLLLYAHSLEALNLLQPHLSEITALTLVKQINIKLLCDKGGNEKHGVFYSTAGHLCNFEIRVNESYEIEKDRRTSKPTNNALNLQKLEKLEKDLERYQTRWQNEGFRKSAKPQIQQQHFEKIQQLQLEIEKIKSLAANS